MTSRDRIPCLALFLLMLTLTGPSAVEGGGFCLPDESQVPDVLTLTPDGSFPYRVVIICDGAPLVGGWVEIEFGPEATPLIAWTDPVPPGADEPVGVGSYGGPIFGGYTDDLGEVVFHIAGSGCVAQKNGAISTDPYVIQMRVDNFLFNEGLVNSPDAVDANGVLPEFLQHSLCDQATSTTSVGLADALYHTPQIKGGLAEICSKFTEPFDAAVGLADAGVLTPYVKAGTTGTCVYNGP